MQGLTSEVEPVQLWLFCFKHDRLRTRNKFEPQVLEHWDHGPHSVNPSVEFEEAGKENKKNQEMRELFVILTLNYNFLTLF